MESVIYFDVKDCIPPHSVKDFKKVERFIKIFENEGFNKNEPCLIGYPWEGKIQLLSGSHRYKAAEIVGLQLPVVLWLRSDVEKSWGDINSWKEIMKEIPISRGEK